MKKLMIAAAAMMAGVAMADVESANIVGYETTTVEKGSTKIFSVQFDNLGESTAIPIRSLLNYSNPKGGTDKTGGGADQIWTYKNDGWQKYYYNSKKAYWCAFNSDAQVPENVTVSTGESFFFQRTSSATASATINLSGAVKPLDLSIPVTVGKGSTVLLCNPWPIGLKIVDFGTLYSNPKGGTDKTGGGADQVWTYKNDAWQKYYYNSKKAYWCAFNSDAQVGADQVVEPGEGFFFQRTSSATGDCTLNFKGPDYKAE